MILFNVPVTLFRKYYHYSHFTNATFGEEIFSNVPKKLSGRGVFEFRCSAFSIAVLKDDGERGLHWLGPPFLRFDMLVGGLGSFGNLKWLLYVPSNNFGHMTCKGDNVNYFSI